VNATAARARTPASPAGAVEGTRSPRGNYKHGLRNTYAYGVWSAHEHCEGWADVASFVTDIGPRPDGYRLIIDARDLLCGACDECRAIRVQRSVRWAPETEARAVHRAKVAAGQTQRIMVGDRTMTRAQAAARLGVTEQAIAIRLKVGVDPALAMTAPKRTRLRRILCPCGVASHYRKTCPTKGVPRYRLRSLDIWTNGRDLVIAKSPAEACAIWNRPLDPVEDADMLSKVEDWRPVEGTSLRLTVRYCPHGLLRKRVQRSRHTWIGLNGPGLLAAEGLLEARCKYEPMEGPR
jgi:hypothetical protein